MVDLQLKKTQQTNKQQTKTQHQQTIIQQLKKISPQRENLSRLFKITLVH